MMPLAAVAGAAFSFALFVLVARHSTLDVRVPLGGLYLLIGVTASVGASLLRRNTTKERR